MSKPVHDLDAIIEGLKQQRDELLLQARLAKAEVRDELAGIERKFEQLQSRAEAVRKEAGSASKDIFAAMALVADEVKIGFERIRKRL